MNFLVYESVSYDFVSCQLQRPSPLETANQIDSIGKIGELTTTSVVVENSNINKKSKNNSDAKSSVGGHTN